MCLTSLSLGDDETDTFHTFQKPLKSPGKIKPQSPTPIPRVTKQYCILLHLWTGSPVPCIPFPSPEFQLPEMKTSNDLHPNFVTGSSLRGTRQRQCPKEAEACGPELQSEVKSLRFLTKADRSPKKQGPLQQAGKERALLDLILFLRSGTFCVLPMCPGWPAAYAQSPSARAPGPGCPRST